MKKVVLGGVTAVVLCAAAAACLVVGAAGDLEPIKAKIRSDFPSVEGLSTDALKAQLERGETPLLLDVRRPEEYAVSRLPGARRVDPGAEADALESVLSGVPKDREIVLYCSVGYRSARLGERLQDVGFRNVKNLEGSIFEWAEKGYPLVQGERTVEKVHPYGRAWAWLVSEPLRAYTPEAALGEQPSERR